MVQRLVAVLLLGAVAAPLTAQPVGASLDQLAATPLVTVQISEQLRAPPDQASISAGTEAREPTATAAFGQQAQDRETARRDPRGRDRREGHPDGRRVGRGRLFVRERRRPQRSADEWLCRAQLGTHQDTSNRSACEPARHADRCRRNRCERTQLRASPDPAPLRSEARRRAMARGEAEATEYARNAGFARVRLLAVEEGVSYRASDIVVTGTRIGAAPPPAPPPPPPPPSSIEPGQIATGVSLTLHYRMER